MKYKSITLGVKHLQEKHTAENIVNWLDEMIVKWNIDKNKVVVTTADQGANIKKAVIDCFGLDKYLPCLAHTLNLVVSFVLEKDLEVADIISKIKDIVSYFHRSCVASDELIKLTDLVLLQCVITRWNSEYVMLDRYLQIQEFVATVLIRLAAASVPSPLKGVEITTAKELMVLLKPFKQLTDVLSGEKYLTGCEAIPLIKNLKFTLENISATTDISKRFKRSLQEQLDRRFKNISKQYLVSIPNLLDPRYKKMYLEDEPMTCSKIIDKVCSEIREMKSISAEPGFAVTQNQSSNYRAMPSTSNQTENSIWSYDEVLRSQARATQMARLENQQGTMPIELSYYLSQAPLEKNSCPLKFWDKQPDSELKKLAMRYLTVIASSVPSERMFSHAALVLTEKRSNMTPQHFQELLFLSTLPIECCDLK